MHCLLGSELGEIKRGFLQGPIFTVAELPLEQNEVLEPGNEGGRLSEALKECLRYMM